MKLNETNYREHDLGAILAASNTNVLELAFEGAQGLIAFIKWLVEHAPRSKRIKELQAHMQLLAKAVADLAEVQQKSNAETDLRLKALESMLARIEL